MYMCVYIFKQMHVETKTKIFRLVMRSIITVLFLETLRLKNNYKYKLCTFILTN